MFCDKEFFYLCENLKNEVCMMEESIIERRKDFEFNLDFVIFEEKLCVWKNVYRSELFELFVGLKSVNLVRMELLM